MEALETFAAGDAGLSSVGYVEYFERRFTLALARVEHLHD
jgi:hypothetical protein